jgi:hypothetical protein
MTTFVRHFNLQAHEQLRFDYSTGSRRLIYRFEYPCTAYHLNVVAYIEVLLVQEIRMASATYATMHVRSQHDSQRMHAFIFAKPDVIPFVAAASTSGSSTATPSKVGVIVGSNPRVPVWFVGTTKMAKCRNNIMRRGGVSTLQLEISSRTRQFTWQFGVKRPAI